MRDGHEGRAAAAKASAETIDLLDDQTIEYLGEMAKAVTAMLQRLEAIGATRTHASKIVAGYCLGFVFDHDAILQAQQEDDEAE